MLKTLEANMDHSTNCFEAAGMPVAAAKTAGMLAAQALTVDPTPP